MTSPASSPAKLTALATSSSAAPAIRKLSILMPVFNEIRTLRQILDRVLAAPLPCEREIVIVDDASTDGSYELARQLASGHPCMRVFRHSKNRGKGAAIRTAIGEMSGDWAVIQDADLEYDPRDLGRLLEPVLDGVADAVFGSRFRMGRYARAMFFWHALANRILTLVANVFGDLNLTDMETCYKLVRADILRALVIRSSGFDLEPELTLKLARWGARIYEVPISYRGRTYAEGKKIGFRDAVMAMIALCRYRFFDRRYCTHEGFMILQAVQRARRFNRWLFGQFADHLGKRVIEAGSGIGNVTELLLSKQRLLCLDNDPFYLDRLDDAYGHLANFRVARADLADRGSVVKAVDGVTFDSLICINVLEHLEDDASVLRTFFDVLPPGGRCIILVPHDPKLFSAVDQTLGHHRRYTPGALRQKLTETGFEVVSVRTFNRVGGFGWWFSGKVLRKRTLTTGQMRIFEWIMPLVRLAERLPLPFANSLIGIARKPG